MFKIIKEILSYVIIIVVVILIRTFIGTPVRVNGTSMVPTLKEGEVLYLNKLNKSFDQEDIVVIDKNVEGSAIIKRIIGMPGDKIEIKQYPDGKYAVLINDKPLKESYILSEYDSIPCSPNMYCGPMIVPEGKYFMMGDNRGNSEDSRFWGFLPEGRIVGRACCIFWPLNRIKSLSLK